MDADGISGYFMQVLSLEIGAIACEQWENGLVNTRETHFHCEFRCLSLWKYLKYKNRKIGNNNLMNMAWSKTHLINPASLSSNQVFTLSLDGEISTFMYTVYCSFTE